MAIELVVACRDVEGLSPKEKSTLVALATFADEAGFVHEIPAERIARATDFRVRTVQRALAGLRKSGLIAAHHRANHPNSYSVDVGAAEHCQCGGMGASVGTREDADQKIRVRSAHESNHMPRSANEDSAVRAPTEMADSARPAPGQSEELRPMASEKRSLKSPEPVRGAAPDHGVAQPAPEFRAETPSDASEVPPRVDDGTCRAALGELCRCRPTKDHLHVEGMDCETMTNTPESHWARADSLMTVAKAWSFYGNGRNYFRELVEQLVARGWDGPAIVKALGPRPEVSTHPFGLIRHRLEALLDSRPPTEQTALTPTASRCWICGGEAPQGTHKCGPCEEERPEGSKSRVRWREVWKQINGPDVCPGT
ncbi:hypothetical protein [Salininema proteolyticum]|uniref:Helix-turn-helix domain-containing protein n=1 Tax=Salininema proteolyticum TaxID=1607685 RepID=A0ABV8TVK2_9ACTN